MSSTIDRREIVSGGLYIDGSPAGIAVVSKLSLSPQEQSTSISIRNREGYHSEVEEPVVAFGDSPAIKRAIKTAINDGHEVSASAHLDGKAESRTIETNFRQKWGVLIGTSVITRETNGPNLISKKQHRGLSIGRFGLKAALGITK